MIGVVLDMNRLLQEVDGVLDLLLFRLKEEQTGIRVIEVDDQVLGEFVQQSLILTDN